VSSCCSVLVLCLLCIYLQFANNRIQDNRGTFPLVEIANVGSKLNFTGNVIMNSASYYRNSERPVIRLAYFQYPAEIIVSYNQFSNPDAIHEISADHLPSTFILDLGLNFWDRSNYSGVIRRYVRETYCQRCQQYGIAIQIISQGADILRSLHLMCSFN